MRRVGGGEACLMWNPPWGAGNPGTRADCLEGWGGGFLEGGCETSSPGKRGGYDKTLVNSF